MGQEGVLGDRQPQVLAAAANASDRAPTQDGHEIRRSGQMAPDRARVQDLHRVDGAPDHVPFQARADSLDLR
jgi:hypothetical protein